MDQDPLVTEEIDAGAELVRGFGEHRPVKAAFWLRAGEAGKRYLYIASDEINTTNFHQAYEEVLELAFPMRNPYFDPFRVKVIGGDHPLARSAAQYLELFPGPLAIRRRDEWFGDRVADDLYIYPATLTAQVS